MLKILLLGQPTLNLVLESPRMAELVTGNVSRFSLNAFSEDQTAAYVAHRLRAAGAPNPDALMPYTLLPQIHACSLGIAANINKLCQRALIHAREEGAGLVTTSALDKAIEDLDWGPSPIADGKRGARTGRGARVDAEPGQARHHRAGRAGPGSVADFRPRSGGAWRGSRCAHRLGVHQPLYHALIVRDGNRDLLLDLWAAPTACW